MSYSVNSKRFLCYLPVVPVSWQNCRAALKLLQINSHSQLTDGALFYGKKRKVRITPSRLCPVGNQELLQLLDLLTRCLKIHALLLSPFWFWVLMPKILHEIIG